jgi:hypothetical protein
VYVHVDLSNKSCVVAGGTVQYGQWAPAVTRRTVEDTIADYGWHFAPGSEWVLTVDGGTREVVRDPAASAAVREDDALLDCLGQRIPTQPGTDHVHNLLAALRADVDSDPTPVPAAPMTLGALAALVDGAR